MTQNIASIENIQKQLSDCRSGHHGSSASLQSKNSVTAPSAKPPIDPTFNLMNDPLNPMNQTASQIGSGKNRLLSNSEDVQKYGSSDCSLRTESSVQLSAKRQKAGNKFAPEMTQLQQTSLEQYLHQNHMDMGKYASLKESEDVVRTPSRHEVAGARAHVHKPKSKTLAKSARSARVVVDRQTHAHKRRLLHQNSHSHQKQHVQSIIKLDLNSSMAPSSQDAFLKEINGTQDDQDESDKELELEQDKDANEVDGILEIKVSTFGAHAAVSHDLQRMYLKNSLTPIREASTTVAERCSDTSGRVTVRTSGSDCRKLES